MLFVFTLVMTKILSFVGVETRHATASNETQSVAVTPTDKLL